MSWCRDVWRRCIMISERAPSSERDTTSLLQLKPCIRWVFTRNNNVYLVYVLKWWSSNEETTEEQAGKMQQTPTCPCVGGIWWNWTDFSFWEILHYNLKITLLNHSRSTRRHGVISWKGDADCLRSFFTIVYDHRVLSDSEKTIRYDTGLNRNTNISETHLTCFYMYNYLTIITKLKLLNHTLVL